MRRVTMREVAEAAGVSPSTVSFVLNDAPGQTISEATRARVRDAAERLGYSPHGLARALREGASRLVVLNAARLPHDRAALSQFIEGLDAELDAHGYTLLVRHGNRRDDGARLDNDLAPRAVIDLERVYGADDPASGDGGWAEGVAAHTAVQVRYLVARGHRRLALVTAPDTHVDRLAVLRRRWMDQVLAEVGLQPCVAVELGADAAGDDAALLRLLETDPRVTAVAGLDDAAALRVLAAARRVGVEVPRRLAVMGFDDSPLSAFAVPALTTVAIDAEGFGRDAAREVLGMEPVDRPPRVATVVRRDSA